MNKLLCIVGGMNTGGAETFLMKVLRSLDRSSYTMDFCVAIEEKGYYDEEIERLGSKIYHIPPKTKNPFSSFNAIKKVVKDGKYDSVLRISQNSMSAIDLIAAKCGGAKNLLFRSSNTGTCGNRVDDIAHFLCKPIAMVVPTIKIAPSSEAAAFMFGKSSLKKGNVAILKNGLNIDLFEFDKKKRNNIRSQQNWEDYFVIGHVGRFNKQKNHKFLISIFSNEKIDKKKIKLVLIGSGELEEETRSLVNKLGISNSVEFMGIRNNVNELMMAFDAFVLPSYYEGMPNVAIEAQTTGLPCLLSSTITKEVIITDLVRFIDINDETAWINSLNEISFHGSVDREKYAIKMREAGYSIYDVIEHFKKLAF